MQKSQRGPNENRVRHSLLAKALAEQALQDEDKTRDELIVEVQKLRRAYVKVVNKSIARGDRIKELENSLEFQRKAVVQIGNELRALREAATPHERVANYTPLRIVSHRAG